MTTPTPERIAAALALAEADDFHERHPSLDAAYKAHDAALKAYRATAPKLRTRAEVDAEIATVVRMAYGAGSVQVRSGAVNMTGRIEALCAERTMADAIRERIRDTQDSGPSSEIDSSPRVAATGAAISPEPSRECAWCQDSKHPPLYQNRVPERIEWVCQQCLLERGPNPSESSNSCDCDPCSCDESEQLKTRIAAILDCIVLHGGSSYRVRDIVPPKLKEGL